MMYDLRRVSRAVSISSEEVFVNEGTAPSSD